MKLQQLSSQKFQRLKLTTTIIVYSLNITFFLVFFVGIQILNEAPAVSMISAFCYSLNNGAEMLFG